MWASLEGLVIGDRYELGEHLATGGMAVIFKGWDHRVQRPVAIKMLRQLERANREAVSRFQREAHAVAMLNHPNVVRAYDFFEEYGCSYLVMELVDGLNLKQHLRRHGPLAQLEALDVAEQVCSALAAAHAYGFVHRDIKPQNILLDSSGIVKVADFGIVHIQRGATLTADGMVLGTADYIAPEQARGEELTAATDVYALGVVLYEMLTGQVPFTGASPMAVASRHASEPVPPPSCVAQSVSPYVEAVVLRALHKHPLRRYQSAATFARALRIARESVAEPARVQPALEDDVAADALAASVPNEARALATVGAAVGAAPGPAAQQDATPEWTPKGAADSELPAPEDTSASDLGWTDMAAMLLEPGASLSAASAFEAQPGMLQDALDGAGRAVALELGTRASWLRLALVVFMSLALLCGTLGLELWINVHAAGIGLPLP